MMCASLLDVSISAGTRSRLEDLAKRKPTTEKKAESEKSDPAVAKEEVGKTLKESALPDDHATKEPKIDQELKERLENASDPQLYVIGPNDKVSVKVFQEAELDSSQTVDAGGNIRLELIDTVKIGGLSVVEAQKLIQKKFAEDYLQDPRVTLNIVERAKKRFVILGQVRSPGYYEVPRSIRLNIFQAMALAGGYTRLAGKVIIKRTTSRGEEIRKFRLKRLENKPQNEIPIIAEDDTIIVGETYF